MVLQELKNADNDNISASSLANGIIATIKEQIQDGSFSLDIVKLANLIKDLSEVESSNKPYITLTVALLKNINQKAHNIPIKPTIPPKSITTKSQPVATQPEPKQYQSNVDKPAIVKEDPNLAPPNSHPKEATRVTPQKNESEFSHDIWQNILEDLRGSYNTLYSVLRVAEINLNELKDQKVHLKFKFPFHQKRISEQKNSLVLHDKFTEHGFGHLEIVCGVIDKPSKKTNLIDQDITESKPEPNNVLSQIRGVFDGAEVIE
jgi:hypothetical protein